MWRFALAILASGPSFTDAVLSADAVVSSDGKAQTVLFPPDQLPALPSGMSCEKQKSLWLVKDGASLGGWVKPDPLLAPAIVEAKKWPEERMRAVGASELWKAERAALKSDNPFLRRLAAAFLEAHQASNVVDEVWGKKGTAERDKNESRAAEPKPMNCR